MLPDGFDPPRLILTSDRARRRAIIFAGYAQDREVARFLTWRLCRAP
jgi:hypothetical protein